MGLINEFRNKVRTEVERLKVPQEPTRPNHYHIARIYSNGVLGEELLLSVPFRTRQQLRDFKKYFKQNSAGYKVKDDRIDLEGDWIV